MGLGVKALARLGGWSTRAGALLCATTPVSCQPSVVRHIESRRRNPACAAFSFTPPGLETAVIYDVERGVIWMDEDEDGHPVGEVIDLGQYNLYRS